MTPKLERWLVTATGIAVALPFTIMRAPPMRDLVMHEAAVSVLAHGARAPLFPPGLYTQNLGHPNQLFSLVATLFALALPTTLACKIVATLAIAAVAPAAGHLAHHLGRPRMLGVAALPAVLGWLFYWGVVQNILGLSVLLAALPALDRFCLTPSRRGAVRATGMLLLLYFAHLQMMGVACLFVCLAALARTRNAPLVLTPVALVVIIVAVEARVQPRSLAQVQDAATTFSPLWHKVVIVPGMLFPGQRPLVRLAAWLPVLALVATLLTARRDLTFDPFALVPSLDARRYRYVVAHSPGGLLARTAERALEPEFRTLGRSGEWILFESTLPLVSLTAPDDPFPPRQPTLRERMRAVYPAVRAELHADAASTTLELPRPPSFDNSVAP
jgi:hypothetical protein